MQEKLKTMYSIWQKEFLDNEIYTKKYEKMTHKTSNEQSFFLNREKNFSSRQIRTLQKRRGMKNEILMQFVKTWPSGSWNTSFQITCSTSFSKVPNKCAMCSFILLIFNHFLSKVKFYNWSGAFETCFSVILSIDRLRSSLVQLYHVT